MRRSSPLALPMRRAEDVVPFLGKPTHWKQGRSAKSLADRWFHAGGVPPIVSAVLDRSPTLASDELLDAWLERETDLLDERGTASQTDLLALLGTGDTLTVLGVEAKVDESFGPIVMDWLSTGGTGRLERLTRLRGMLGLAEADVGALHYQLFHRTAAVILEARRFRAHQAVLLVQSFCPRATGIDDARAFFSALGLKGLTPGALLGPIERAGVSLWVGWVADAVPEPEYA